MTVDHHTLIAQAQQGDPKAFEELYRSYYAPLYRFALTRMKSPDDAEDITQEVFIKLLAALPTYRAENPSLLPYLFVMARNKIIDHYRKRRPEYDEEGLWKIASEDPTPEESAVLGEETAYVIRLLNTLGEAESEIVRLKYLDGYSTAEIASILHKKEDAIRQTLSRSIRHMRSLYTSQGSP